MGDRILNPVTGRYVLATGKVGQQLLAEQMSRKLDEQPDDSSSDEESSGEESGDDSSADDRSSALSGFTSASHMTDCTSGDGDEESRSEGASDDQATTGFDESDEDGMRSDLKKRDADINQSRPTLQFKLDGHILEKREWRRGE